MLTPAMPCGSHPNRPPAPSIVLPPQLTISRAARRWLPRRRLLRRQLRLPRIRPGALLALVRHLSSTAAARRNAARRGGRRPRLPPAAVPHTDSAAARMPAQATSATAPPQPVWLRLHGDTSPGLDYRHYAIVTWALLDKGQSVAQRSQVSVTHPTPPSPPLSPPSPPPHPAPPPPAPPLSPPPSPPRASKVFVFMEEK